MTKKTSRRRAMPRVESLETRRLFAAGTPDATFGNAGLAITDLPAVGERAQLVIPLADGRAITVGTTAGPAGIVRYNADGSLDPTFGDGGKVLFLEGQWTSITPMDAVLLDDGRLLVVWTSSRIDAANDIFEFGQGATVFSPSGDPQSVTLPMSTGAWTRPRRLGDGKILVFDNVAGATPSTTDGVLYRLNANLTLDTTFGVNGKVLVPDATMSHISDVQIRPDGRIVAFDLTGTEQLTIAGFNADGSPDAAVGGDGILVVPRNPWSFGPGALAPDGGYYFTAWIVRDLRPITVVKLTAQGTIDTTFGVDGAAESVEPFSNVRITDMRVRVQPDGKIVVSASTNNRQSQGDPIVVRYNTNGMRDRAFATDGMLRLQTDQEHGSEIFDLEFAADGSGKILAAGHADGRFLLMRLTADDSTAPPPPPGTASVLLENRILTITGTSGADVITADLTREGVTDVYDVIINGRQQLFDADDVDRLLILAGAGNDAVDLRRLVAIVDAGTDFAVTIEGGSGNDVLVGSMGRDRITGGDDNDKIHGWDGDDWLSGNAQKDRIDGGRGNDSILGNGGRDTLGGNVGNDTCLGGDQPDLVTGYDGNDSVDGGGGHDRVDGGAGIDIITGGGGDDRLYARDGAIDQVIGGRAGFDRAEADEDDDLVSIEQLL